MLVANLGLMNLLAFYMFWLDKRNARKRRWRIPENTLLGVAFIGGSLGALLGMYIFRHKTKHWKFKILIPLFLMLHILILIIY
jgi:uncharacterized membrane protein YsdA (DUF1294 family)